MNRVLVLIAIMLAALIGAIACGALFPPSPVPAPASNPPMPKRPQLPALSAGAAGPTPTSRNPPTPKPKTDFPLASNNTWVFQATRYVGYPSPDVIMATLVITETVVDVQSVSSYFVAKIHQDRSAEMPLVVPASRQGELRAAESDDYWLVLMGNRLYSQDRLDLSKLEAALVKFVFPLAVGDRWALTENQTKMLPPGKTPGMTREVMKRGTVDVPAGRFAGCYFLREEWSTAIFEDWFCPHVGIVDSKSDHRGAPEGWHRALIGYRVER